MLVIEILILKLIEVVQALHAEALKRFVQQAVSGQLWI
jgi:hypothetical protein